MHYSFTFFKEFLRTPAIIGAICPSSNHLAHTVCTMLPATKKAHDLVVEVGPGTGAITKCLVNKMHDTSRILLVERSPRLTGVLRTTFPDLAIINGDAVHLDSLLPHDSKVSALISSMPLLTIEKNYRHQIISQIKNALTDAGVFILVSYNFRCNKDILAAGFHSERHKFVMRNIPPARIDCFVRNTPKTRTC